MKAIIDPVAKELIENELTEDKFLQPTNNAGNKLYVVTAADSPNIMREIGRLRELTFRDAGGGTGEEVDIDYLDTAPEGYKQLIVWDPEAKEITGGYRYIISRSSHTHISTEHYFDFSDKFRTEYLPHTIELGRSFVQPAYQGSRVNPKGLYALDNLWNGIGVVIMANPDTKYLFGKVTMYENYNPEARNILQYFLMKYFPDKEKLVTPKDPMLFDIDTEKMEAMFNGETYIDDYKTLGREVRKLGEHIPPLINSYMNLSPTMKVFGTVCNTDFGAVEETGILITLADIYPQKLERHTSRKR